MRRVQHARTGDEAHRVLIGPDGVIRYARRGKPPVEEVLGAASGNQITSAKLFRSL